MISRKTEACFALHLLQKNLICSPESHDCHANNANTNALSNLFFFIVLFL